MDPRPGRARRGGDNEGVEAVVLGTRHAATISEAVELFRIKS